MWIRFYHLPCGGRHHQPYSRPRAQLDMKPKPSRMAAAGTRLELSIAPEHEPNAESDKVYEPATSSVPEIVLVDCAGMEGSPAYTPTTEHELYLASGNYYNKEVEEDIYLSLPSSLVPPSFQVSFISAGLPSSNLLHLRWSRPKILSSGLLVSSSALARGSLGSASSCQSHHFTSARRSVGSTLAPPSLGSIWDLLPYSSTGLPCPLCLHHRFPGV